ncbi:hypothetical protein SAMN05518672_105384 [Chitinophaga sp. CF118]|nr:hypothetical protein SAMN05518672_105384 [Chitinophaga sp. CF118]
MIFWDCINNKARDDVIDIVNIPGSIYLSGD